MRTESNVVLQIAALVVALLLRVAAPGILLIFFVASLIGPALLLAPSGLALGLLRRRVLPAALAVPFVACAVTLVLAALTFPDTDDAHGYAPLSELLGHGERLPELYYEVGHGAALGWLGSLVWLLVALAVVHRPGRRPAGPGDPSWSRPA